MDFWIKKPGDDKSVSLSFLVLSFTYLVVMSSLLAMERIKTMGGAVELFITCASLYFGRGLSISNKPLNGSSKEESEDSEDEK